MEILKSGTEISLIGQILVFFFLSFIILASSILVVTLRNIVHCALFLILSLLGVAGIYLMLNADFLAAVQILIYAGGIVILMIFAILLTQQITGKEIKQTNEQKGLGFLVSLILFFILLITLSKIVFPVNQNIKILSSTSTIGELLLKKYILHFELVSVVLLVAMLGAIIFVRKE